MNTPIQALMQQKALLQVEYACEKESFRRQTEATGMARKVKRGDAWYPVTAGRSYYNCSTSPVWRLCGNRMTTLNTTLSLDAP